MSNFVKVQRDCTRGLQFETSCSHVLTASPKSDQYTPPEMLWAYDNWREHTENRRCLRGLVSVTEKDRAEYMS
jgi:hypothetical protein